MPSLVPSMEQTAPSSDGALPPPKDVSPSALAKEAAECAVQAAPPVSGGEGQAALAEMWARLVADTRSRKQTFLAGALNRACLLDFRNGIARIGFTPDSQAARNEAEHAVRDIEAFLTAQAGRPVTLIFESAAPEQSAMSMASRERAQREDREDALRNACLDSDAVRLVKKMLGASVSQVMPNMDFGSASGGTAFNDFVVDADDGADD